MAYQALNMTPDWPRNGKNAMKHMGCFELMDDPQVTSATKQSKTQSQNNKNKEDTQKGHDCVQHDTLLKAAQLPTQLMIDR